MPRQSRSYDYYKPKGDRMANNIGPPIEIPEFTLENWMPMEPQKGPPLPSFLGIYWPWYKPPSPPLLTGFSLMIENPVSGAAYWLADFPYSAYEGKIALREIDEAGWITQEAPGMDSIRILFLDANYQCPAGDPYCEGLIFYLLFEDGHHYILDCSTGELRENPSPPSMPEVPIGEPSLIDIALPAVPSGGEFWPEATIYLPKVLGENQYYAFSAVIEVIEGIDIKGREGVKTVPILSAVYVAPSIREMEISQFGVTAYLPLDSPDAVYHVRGLEFPASTPSRPATVPLPPGSYPVRATIRSSYALWVPGPAGGIGITQPQRDFDLGIVGMLEVT